MKITKNIESAGNYLRIPIKDDDQTVGLTISGSYSGVFEIVGMISQEGGQLQIIPYKLDGTVGSLTDPTPIDLFLDVIAGLSEIRIVATSWSSGSAAITAITSNGERYIPGSSSGSSGSSTSVVVSNFPTDQAKDATLQMLLQYHRGIDSDGDLLPLNFDSYGSIFSYDVNSLVQSEVRIIGSDTYTRSYTYDNNQNVTGSSQWVKT